MIEKVLNRKNLYKAYRQVVRNKGSAGVDGMKVTELLSFLESNRDRIATSILNHSYVPKPIKGVEIPKSNGKTRLLGVPTVVDRWLQQALSQVLMTKYELTFEEHSYGFRPEKNIHKAVTQALKNINDGYQDIVDIDLKGFFDEVDHSVLLQLIYQRVKCPTTLRLIRKWLRAPIRINGKLHRRRKGVPQGSPISPLLSNILLDLLDKELERRNLKYVRYADDFSIYTKSKKEARKVGNEIYLFLKEKLRLPINREKSGIRRPSNFEMLGHAFVPTYQKGVKGKYQLVVKKNSWDSLKRKLKQITKKTKPYSFEERLKKLAEVWQGWVNNYRLASISAKLKSLDEWLRNRLRYCIWHDWKKPERKRKNLIRLGVDQDHAYAWSRTRKGGWAVAQSPILITTITLSRLRRKGYESMLSYYLKSQPTIQ
ncbi:group II intron reverse transcriptase/maturase [Belliella aquatica]|uniref:RNA-directed DNA polymerase n=1 Tax=Belliella aquatica TaxID=1323734 RepID=A0ABQ1N747_9BACT|nr:group II intron reverse transcriptase/maturase [Belliella aquatica]MCH7407729.1 group II intron reverse transcriptase/maturase [Belliella aquatica]GGC55620.1 group II intron reverse transcriptase/maturase [Belliella aquatica]